MRIIIIACVCIVSLFACRANRDDSEVVPPVTAPLSRNYIGYGVITDSFTHITVDPQENSISLGYLRRGSLVRIIRRQIVKTDSGFQTWVLTDEPQYGWLKEDVMGIYNSEGQAKTASEQLAGSRQQ
ncbi:MAG: hypothetical protein LBU88_06770 [Treponema sp.]|jgi:hypothetical protein|nr:hypothetical protein [Treponema sp.]